ncbi:2-hydroxychromene-2-carboxylate isomerase [Parahaliea mediterranea]|uniref:2-hydroxychromene-2-carboxylate isomerase n=1 Tax=Parahaliea mediterranea TaxID=651086 RepID=A0A939DDT3_9GAMM|nr:DsbA family protein [Parahaliea mediterranea]MBN7796341.1 DsbA family protein [Parahaliea mediterranea]
MSHIVDVYFSFRSPYSYLVTPDLMRLRDDYAVELHLRPVLPIALRTKDTLFATDRKPLDYILIDVLRRAEFLGMKIGFPSPDPIVQDMGTFEVAKEQPYIHRLTGLGVEAQRRGKGIELAYHVSHLIWGGEPGWDEGDRLADAVARAGLDLAQMETALAGYDPMTVVEANHAALDAAGHWGVPTMVFEGEPFFGQDRVDTLRWRLDKVGVPKR